MANRSITIFINGKEVENNIKSIRNEYHKLINEQAKLTRGTEEYIAKGKEIKKVKGILDEHNQQFGKAGQMWNKMKDGIAAFAPYVAGAFAAIKFGETVIASSSAASDKWTIALDGAKSGWEAVKRAMATNWDFSNVMKAVSLGKELAQLRDELEDSTRSLTVVEAKYQAEIDKLEFDAADQTKSDDERRNSLKAAITLAKDLNNQQIGNAQQNYNINEQNILFETKLAEVKEGATAEEKKQAEDIAKMKLKNFVEEFNHDKALRDQASAYLELKKKYAELPMVTEAEKKAAIDFVKANPQADNYIGKMGIEIENTSEIVKTYASILTAYGEASDETIDNFIQSSKNLYVANGKFYSENKKLQSKLTGFEADLMKQKEDDEKKKKDLQDDWLKAESALNDKIIKLRNDLEVYNLTAKEKEVAQTKQKYQALYKEAEGHKDKLKQFKELEGQELLAIDIKYANEAIKESQQLADKLLKINQDRFEKVKKANQDEGDAVRQIELALLDEGDRKKQEEIFAIEDKYSKLIDLAKKYGFDTVALKRQMEAELANVQTSQVYPFGMNAKQWDEFKVNFRAVQELAGMALDSFQAVNDIMNANNEEYLQRSEESNNKQKESLERRLNAGVISQTQYNRRVANLDKDLDSKKKEVEKEQAKRAKKLAIFQTVINTAAAIVGFLSMMPITPWNIALSIAAGVTGAIQLAAITKAQPFAKGGRIKKETFARMGEAGEEGVISNRTLTDPITGPISNWLLDRQDGKNPMFPTTINPAQMGSTSSVGVAASVAPIVNVSVPAQDNSEMLNKLEEIRVFLSDPLNRQAYISNDLLKQNSDDQNFRNSLQKTNKKS